MSRGRRLLVAVLAAVILLCSWSAWGAGDPDADPVAGVFDVVARLPEGVEAVIDDVLETELFSEPSLTFDFTGWRGKVSLRGLESPNAAAVLAGVLMGLLALTPVRGRWPAILALQLGVYGTFHLGVLTVVLAAQQGVRPAGWVTLTAFALAVVVLVQGLADWRKDLAKQGVGRTLKHRVAGAFGVAPPPKGRGGAKVGGAKGGKAGGAAKARAQPALLSRRVAAYVLDVFFIGLWIGVLTGVVQLLPERVLEGAFDGPGRSQLVIVAALTLPVVLGFALFECGATRASPGKRLMGLWVRDLRVAHRRRAAARVPFRRAVLRNAVKFLPWELAHTGLWRTEGWPGEVVEFTGLALALLVGSWVLVLASVVLALVRKDRRAVHDLAAGTQIVS